MPYFGNSILKNYVILLLDDPKLLLFVYLIRSFTSFIKVINGSILSIKLKKKR